MATGRSLSDIASIRASVSDALLSHSDAWRNEATSCSIRMLETFAADLASDRAVVRAARASPWSNAQVAGRINKFKLHKRPMDGRAKRDLLR